MRNGKEDPALLLLQSGHGSQQSHALREAPLSQSIFFFSKGCSDLAPVGPGVYKCAPAVLQSM